MISLKSYFCYIIQKRGKLMTRGGTRPGAGRKPIGKQTTKATIYKADRELINGYARSLGISVNELIHRIFRHQNFDKFLEKFE